MQLPRPRSFSSRSPDESDSEPKIMTMPPDRPANEPCVLTPADQRVCAVLNSERPTPPSGDPQGPLMRRNDESLLGRWIDYRLEIVVIGKGDGGVGGLLPSPSLSVPSWACALDLRLDLDLDLDP